MTAPKSGKNVKPKVVITLKEAPRGLVDVSALFTPAIDRDTELSNTQYMALKIIEFIKNDYASMRNELRKEAN